METEELQPISVMEWQPEQWRPGDECCAPELAIASFDSRPLIRNFKRCFDLVFSAAALVMLSPALVLIAISIKLTSPGPVLYKCRRVSKGGRHFTCLKFRTMAANADELLRFHLASNAESARTWREIHKLKNDPRVTSVGRFLRKFSFDELPQFWNILAGDMSIVGPRPIVDVEVARYGDLYPLYASVLPGITGLWQVSGRSNTSYEDRVRLDATYVLQWSPVLDLKILLKTIVVVSLGQGAY